MSFTLRSLLLAFLVIAAALGTFGPWGLAVGILIVAGVAFFRDVPDSCVGCVVAVFIGFVLIVLLLPAFQDSREAGRRMQCVNNLKQIALALHNYHQEYGCFPPAYVPGPDGKPWHSWRVLILPFVEQQSLYATYRFDEPWDGPNNRKLAASTRIPSIYVCPSSDERQTGSGDTNYLAVVGPKTAWPGAKPRRIDEIRDGASNTILVMEARGLGIHWMEPKDLDFDRVAAQTQPDPKIIGAIPHPYEPDFFYIVEGGVFNVALADGSVHSLRWGVPGRVLAPLLTAQGGEDADPDALVSAYEARLNWPRILSLAVLVISTLLLWRSTRPRLQPADAAGSAERSTPSGERGP
jgi:hypothetical protein